MMKRWHLSANFKALSILYVNKRVSVINCYKLYKYPSLSFIPGGWSYVYSVGVGNLNTNSWLVQLANPQRTGLLFYSLESQVFM